VPGLTPEAALATLPERVEMVHVGTLGLVYEPTAAALEAVVEKVAGEALVMVDLNIRPLAVPDPEGYRARIDRLLPRTDVVKASDDDLAWLDPDRAAIDVARGLLSAGPSVVLLTRGGEGVTVVTADGATDVPAEKVDVVDTIGAGDAFGGGFLAWWRARGLGREQLDDQSLVVAAASFGALVAARTVARAGASPPYLHEVTPATDVADA
jgi:fructokinase